MNNFKEWLLTESITIANNINGFPLVVGPGLKPIKDTNREELKEFVYNSLKQYFGDSFKQAMNRYDIFLKEIRSGYSEIIFSFELKPQGIRTPEVSDPSDYRHDFNVKYKNGNTGFYIHKTPKDAIKEIPKDESLVYRGMSYEEWQFIRKNGFIKSNAGYNLGTAQQELTFYGSAETAEHYASGFAPMQFKTSVKKPAIVIAISRSHVKDHKDMPDAIPSSEFAHEGKLDSKEIKHAWMLTPTRSKAGSFDLIFEYKAQKNQLGNYDNLYYLSNPREGSRSGPSIGYSIRQIL